MDGWMVGRLEQNQFLQNARQDRPQRDNVVELVASLVRKQNHHYRACCCTSRLSASLAVRVWGLASKNTVFMRHFSERTKEVVIVIEIEIVHLVFGLQKLERTGRCGKSCCCAVFRNGSALKSNLKKNGWSAILFSKVCQTAKSCPEQINNNNLAK